MSLAVGENPVTITVTAEDGTVRTYTVTVTRAEDPATGELMAPTNVRADPVVGGSVNVAWDHEGGAAGYIIIAVNVADPSQVVSKAVNSPDARSGAIADLAAGQEYNIYVAAFRSVEEFAIDLTQKARVTVE